ncbi:MAG: GNAT family N-acetyltransferase [Pseudomonadota bacterium]
MTLSITIDPNLHIRWAKPLDADALNPLLRALYRHDVPEAPAPTDETVAAHVARLVHAYTPHRLAVAWDNGGTAVGLAAVGTFVSVSDPRPERWTHQELKEIFVLPERRGIGIGTALMSWIERQARRQGVCRLDWHVKRDNLRSIAFYERLGARIVDGRMSVRKELLKDRS